MGVGEGVSVGVDAANVDMRVDAVGVGGGGVGGANGTGC